MAEVRDITESGELRDITIDDTRGLRYAELAMIGPEFITIYNSTGLSEAPPVQWDPLDTEKIAHDYDLKAVFKNGPHWWLSDTTTFRFGDELRVESMGFRWAATLPAYLAGSGGLEGTPYEAFEANKRGTFVYSKGKSAYELVSPEGDVYIMQSSSIAADDSMATLGGRLKLPDGWTFRSPTLGEDLTLELDGKVKAVMDDLRNVYNLVPTVSPGRGRR
jgi:hypothetical protein